MNLDDLKAKPGEPVLPKYNALIRRLGSIVNAKAGRGIRARQSDLGTTYVADVPGGGVFVPSFKVRLTADAITVGLGTVNARVPVMRGIALDDANPPSIPMRLLGSNAENRSWIALSVVIDYATGELLPDDEAISVVQRPDLANTEPGIAVHPLAMLIWKDKSISAVHQITMHDLQYAAVRITDPARVRYRHLFWPA